ncbi:MAG: hypothetical protein ACI9BV_003822 [Rhodothermales bacterium]|jgi:hypothetical protein
MGGSTTLCLWMREDKRFPYLSGRSLEGRTGLRVNAFNSARSGSDSVFSLNKLVNMVVPMRPEVAVMMHNINDLVQLLYGSPYWEGNRPKTQSLSDLSSGSMIYGDHYAKRRGLLSHTRYALRRVLSPPQRDRPDTPMERSPIDANRILSDFRRSLITFVVVTRTGNIEPVLMTQQNRITGIPVDQDLWLTEDKGELERRGISREVFRHLYGRMNDTIRDMAREQEVPLVDLDALIPREARDIYDLTHFTQAGSELASEAIAHQMAPLVARTVARP